MPRSERRTPPTAFPAARFFAAPESPWPCRGWNRCPLSPTLPPPAAFPKRFGVLFMGNGINEDHWSAEGSGADMKLSKTLSPLEPLKHKINVIDGLFNKAATGQGIHPAQTGSLLSGAHIQKGAIIHSGISVDQMIANAVGQDTPQSSIVLACEQPMTGYHETNFSLAYSSHISWQTPDSPVPVEVYPSLAWDNLFENRGSLRNISILDRVKDRAEALSREDQLRPIRAKLDEYLTSVREVEKRVDGMRKIKDKADDAAKAKKPPAFTMDRPANGLPEDLRDHARLMCDIIAIAFQTDKTRVASLIISRDLSAMYYPFLEVKEGHHARLAQQQLGWLRTHRAFPFEPVRLSGDQARQHAGRRRHGARQFVPDVPLQHVDRPQARQHAVAAGAGGRSGRHARDRPHAELSGRRRRQPQDVQPVPVDHGPHGSQARSLWRRGRAACGRVDFLKITARPVGLIS